MKLKKYHKKEFNETFKKNIRLEKLKEINK